MTAWIGLNLPLYKLGKGSLSKYGALWGRWERSSQATADDLGLPALQPRLREQSRRDPLNDPTQPLRAQCPATKNAPWASVIFFFFSVFCFFRTATVAYGSPRLEAESELLLSAYATAKATCDPCGVCDLHCSSR